MSSLLLARALTHRYRGGPTLLQDWSAEFASGESVAITGPSGRGKSTLLYLLALMLTPMSGHIELRGQNVSALPERERALLRARMFGFVFQDSALDPSRKVIDNVLEPTLYNEGETMHAKGRALELLDRFGVSAQSNSRPTQISGGQSQRIAVCRALINSPLVLLADEPTGNLDPSSADVVLGALIEHATQGGVSIIVTHDPSVAGQCNRIIEL